MNARLARVFRVLDADPAPSSRPVALVLAVAAWTAAIAPTDASAQIQADDARHRLRPFVLNALLVPLLDDVDPPRWRSDVSAMRCGAGSVVTVDGRPPVPGEPLPSKAFALRWTLVDCRPLDATHHFDGDVSLTVFPEPDGGYSAVVEPRSLRVHSVDGVQLWTVRFGAVMP